MMTKIIMIIIRRGVAALLHYHPALKGFHPTCYTQLLCYISGGTNTFQFHLDLQYEDTIGALAELESLGHPWQV